MPNANRPSGLSPIQNLNGAPWNGKGSLYHIDSTIANALYVGDPVKLVAGLDAAGGLQSIDLAAAADTPVGVIVAVGKGSAQAGPYADPSNLSLTYAPATKTGDYFALVADDPNTIFEVQEDAVGGSAAYTAASKNASWVNATPATGVQLSATMLDSSTVATTNTLGLAIMGLIRKPDNILGTATYPYARWAVKFNKHQYAVARTGL